MATTAQPQKQEQPTLWSVYACACACVRTSKARPTTWWEVALSLMQFVASGLSSGCRASRFPFHFCLRSSCSPLVPPPRSCSPTIADVELPTVIECCWKSLSHFKRKKAEAGGREGGARADCEGKWKGGRSGYRTRRLPTSVVWKRCYFWRNQMHCQMVRSHIIFTLIIKKKWYRYIYH